MMAKTTLRLALLGVLAKMAAGCTPAVAPDSDWLLGVWHEQGSQCPGPTCGAFFEHAVLRFFEEENVVRGDVEVRGTDCLYEEPLGRVLADPLSSSAASLIEREGTGADWVWGEGESEVVARQVSDCEIEVSRTERGVTSVDRWFAGEVRYEADSEGCGFSIFPADEVSQRCYEVLERTRR